VAVARSAASRALVVVAAAVAAGTALVHGQVRSADRTELVTLRSGSYADFRQVFAREAPAGGLVPPEHTGVTVAGMLDLGALPSISQRGADAPQTRRTI
jgi:hypothetical protein